MTIPNQLSLEALIAEDGMDVRAGLPEGLRSQLATARKIEEQSGVMRERVDSILASIAEHEARIAKLHEELRQVVKECTATTTPVVPTI